MKNIDEFLNKVRSIEDIGYFKETIGNGENDVKIINIWDQTIVLINGERHVFDYSGSKAYQAADHLDETCTDLRNIEELQNVTIEYKCIDLGQFPGHIGIRIPDELGISSFEIQNLYLFDGAGNEINEGYLFAELIKEYLTSKNIPYEKYEDLIDEISCGEELTEDAIEDLDIEDEIIDELKVKADYWRSIFKVEFFLKDSLLEKLGEHVENLEIIDGGHYLYDEVGYYQMPISVAVEIFGETIIIASSVYKGSPT